MDTVTIAGVLTESNGLVLNGATSFNVAPTLYGEATDAIIITDGLTTLTVSGATSLYATLFLGNTTGDTITVAGVTNLDRTFTLPGVTPLNRGVGLSVAVDRVISFNGVANVLGPSITLPWGEPPSSGVYQPGSRVGGSEHRRR